MSKLWTKNGRLLSYEGNDVYSATGAHVGRIRGDRVFRRDDGRYVGTLVGDRLVYRSYDMDGPMRAYRRPVTTDEVSAVAPLRTWGDEPKIPD